MNEEKKGFWERGAIDQKAKRTNVYLSVEVRGLVATSDGPGRYDSILCCQLRRQYYLNFLVPSVRPFKSLDICYIQQKTVLSTVFVVLVPKAGQRNRHVFFYRFSLSVEKRSDYRRPLAFPINRTALWGPRKGSSPLTYCYIQQKNRNEYGSLLYWCRRRDLNPHDVAISGF